MTLPEFYQQNSWRLRDQFGRGVRDVESIAIGDFDSNEMFATRRSISIYPNYALVSLNCQSSDCGSPSAIS